MTSLQLSTSTARIFSKPIEFLKMLSFIYPLMLELVQDNSNWEIILFHNKLRNKYVKCRISSIRTLTFMTTAYFIEESKSGLEIRLLIFVCDGKLGHFLLLFYYIVLKGLQLCVSVSAHTAKLV